MSANQLIATEGQRFSRLLDIEPAFDVGRAIGISSGASSRRLIDVGTAGTRKFARQNPPAATAGMTRQSRRPRLEAGGPLPCPFVQAGSLDRTST